jgi:hypothetical protein
MTGHIKRGSKRVVVGIAFLVAIMFSLNAVSAVAGLQVTTTVSQYFGTTTSPVTTVQANSNVLFGAWASDPDGYFSPVSYHWTFTDGKPTGGEADNIIAPHIFDAPGTYTAIVTVQDNLGGSTVASVPIIVSGINQSPQVMATAEVNGLTVHFCANATDPDGTIGYPVFWWAGYTNLVGYDWNFGDGEPTGLEIFSPCPTHTYPAPGPYTASVTVWDNMGASTMGSVQVFLGNPPGQPTNVQPNRTPVAGELEVTWTAPTYQGDSPITSYTITGEREDQQGNYQNWSVPPSPTSYIISGLATGVRYRFRVTAVNAVGPGAASEWSDWKSPKN